ncbi:MAG: lipid A biosynthesis acyltransferase [Flavobacterium sp. BFFFF1]|uniref:lysophospholipid acyltransferase family protein n=1 Tax=Flavobacterium sp. BFFFF1 TaxID=2015557 RepID=UPI000BD2C2BA|nr:lysophospholipid acyltransferase family protein [Flavobacterium sp. BFFFF1]OYU81753.1 MAG: lipid A biosynthesis acyltransferase [Flavobacterium sp. BFFFF1]
MQLLAFVLAYPFLWCVSMLPFRALYIFSDIICFFVYHVFGYRKQTVRKNLEIALPHLSITERRTIEKKFFRHMCDMFLEMIKTMNISDKEIKDRFVFTNMEMIREYEEKGKSVALLCAHYASWEWLVVMAKYTSFRSIAIYKKIGNKYFDKLVRKIRSRLHAELVESKKSIELIQYNNANKIKAFYGFASDQSPQLSKAKYWDQFMGLVHTGAEMLAKKLDLNVLFVKVEKVKRGHYQATLMPLVENPKSVPDYEITSIYLREVEKQILEAPEYYFWTHNRWKHSGKKKATDKTMNVPTL